MSTEVVTCAEDTPPPRADPTPAQLRCRAGGGGCVGSDVVGVVARSDLLHALGEPPAPEEPAPAEPGLRDRLLALPGMEPVFEAVQAVGEGFDGGLPRRRRRPRSAHGRTQLRRRHRRRGRRHRLRARARGGRSAAASFRTTSSARPSSSTRVGASTSRPRAPSSTTTRGALPCGGAGLHPRGSLPPRLHDQRNGRLPQG